MRRFASLTVVLVIALGLFASTFPSNDLYVTGVDDGPPQRFKTIAEAEKAAGFDFPDAGTPEGWRVEDVSVIPANYMRRMLAENPKLAIGPVPNQGTVRFWGNVPEPPPGVRNYVSIAYSSDRGGFIALNINFPIYRPAPVPAMSSATDIKQRRVRIGGMSARLITYTTGFGDALQAEWRVNGVPVRAMGFNFSPNPQFKLTEDEFVAFLTNVR